MNLTGVQLLTKCRQLYQALRNQSVALLVNDQWLIALARDEGVTVSDADAMQLFKHVKAQEFPTEAAQRQYFASRKLSLADELFLLKIDLVEAEAGEESRTGRKADGGGQPKPRSAGRRRRPAGPGTWCSTARSTQAPQRPVPRIRRHP